MLALFYNNEISVLFLGALSLLILSVTLIYLKRIHKRDVERKGLQERKRREPELGDIEILLDESEETRFPKFFQELTKNALLPLFIIVFINLLDKNDFFGILSTFGLLIFILFHEFLWEKIYSSRKFYQIFILLLWIAFFFIMSYRANQRILTESDFQKNYQCPYHCQTWRY